MFEGNRPLTAGLVSDKVQGSTIVRLPVTFPPPQTPVESCIIGIRTAASTANFCPENPGFHLAPHHSLPIPKERSGQQFSSALPLEPPVWVPRGPGLPTHPGQRLFASLRRHWSILVSRRVSSETLCFRTTESAFGSAQSLQVPPRQRTVDSDPKLFPPAGIFLYTSCCRFPVLSDIPFFLYTCIPPI